MVHIFHLFEEKNQDFQQQQSWMENLANSFIFNPEDNVKQFLAGDCPWVLDEKRNWHANYFGEY